MNPNETCITIYNLLKPNKPNRVLNIVSCTRLSKEKGYDKMKVSAKVMKEKKIPYNWHVFTTDLANEYIDGLMFRKAIFNTEDYVANADYTWYMPDTESYGYSIVEALCLGVPVVVTDMPVMKEIGIKHGENGFILDFELKNVDDVIKSMYDKKLKGFKYEQLESDKEWQKILGAETKKRYSYNPKLTVQALLEYYDTQLQRKVLKGEIFEVKDLERLDVLLGKNPHKTSLVQTI
jgi:glycosyltransferase involved in cell wall biosynthesis